jgi:hypothetical protein
VGPSTVTAENALMVRREHLDHDRPYELWLS